MPAILNEAIPAASHHIDIELHASQQLAYRYTALIEMMHQSQNAEMELKETMLKEALYNVRQHEAFLCIILVRFHYVLQTFKVAKILLVKVVVGGWNWTDGKSLLAEIRMYDI